VGEPIKPDSFVSSSKRRVALLTVPSLRVHDIRHGFATLALESGVHPKVVSERLGHASVAFTLDRYSHAVPALEEAAAERVAALMRGA
jgi:integrase